MFKITPWKMYFKLTPVVFFIALALLIWKSGEVKKNSHSLKPVTVIQFNSVEEALKSMAQELGISVDELTQNSDDANHSRITIKNKNPDTPAQDSPAQD